MKLNKNDLEVILYAIKECINTESSYSTLDTLESTHDKVKCLLEKEYGYKF